MYITMCLYITITILLWVLSIYPFIKHYTIVILCEPYNSSHMTFDAFQLLAPQNNNCHLPWLADRTLSNYSTSQKANQTLPLWSPQTISFKTHNPIHNPIVFLSNQRVSYILYMPVLPPHNYMYLIQDSHLFRMKTF